MPVTSISYVLIALLGNLFLQRGGPGSFPTASNRVPFTDDGKENSIIVVVATHLI
ncbi:MAG: hypothetical protein ABSB86_03230 [Bryobacteraceae bacterium]